MKRVFWLDVVRVIAIYFVVVIHNSVSQKPNPSIEDIALSAIISTANPLFVMVSGALLLGKKENYSVFFSKRIKKVLIPWIIWTFIYMFWHYKVDNYKVSSISQLKYFFELTFLSQLWFLPMIFGLYLITPLLRRFIQMSQLKDIYYASALWFIALSVLPFLHNSLAFPLQTDNGLVGQVIKFSGYFILGYLLGNIKLRRYMVFFPLVILALGILWTEFASFHMFNIKNFNGTFSGLLSPNTVMTTLAVFLIIKEFILMIEKNINHRFYAIIIALSKASFGIYLIHQLIMWSIKNNMESYLIFPFYINPVLASLGTGLIFFLLSFFCVYMLQKLPVIKNVAP